eukprot:GFUD01079881.1.p1 GENE.GFUD01079881.1~~GFUD01079881.1.p1  ORF type:complete len:448 (-),score=138.11 GFUD01079881.1:277-1620(-)
MSMKSKVEKEKERVAQDKVQTILTSMLRDEDNKYCVDCDSKGPRWASWNLGVFLCIRCAGIHRNLGVHISKVKSVNLDSWTPPQVASMQAMGNSKGRAVYEANIPDDFRRPQTDSAVESFVRQKYEKRKFIAAEWVPTKPPDVPVGWEDAGPADKKIEFKKLQLPARSSGGTSPVNTSPRVEAKTVASTAPAPLIVSLPPASTTTTSASTTVTDLLGLSLGTATPAQPQPPTNSSTTTSSSQDLLGLNSEFSAFVSASPIPAGPTVTSEDDARAATPSDGRLSKDSILALFGPKSSPTPAQPQTNMFGQFQSSPGLPNMSQFQSPTPGQFQSPAPSQFQSPTPSQFQAPAPGQFPFPSTGLGQFQSPNGQFGAGQASPNPAFNPNLANGTHSNLLGLYSQPKPNTINGFQSQPANNPFLDTNQMAGQLSGLNMGAGTTATPSPSLWQ